MRPVAKVALAGLGLTAGLAVLLWPKKAKADEQQYGGGPTAADADEVLDAETGERGPSGGAVSVPAAVISASGTGAGSLSSTGGSITVPVVLPAAVDAVPVEPDEGDTVTAQTPGIWEQPSNPAPTAPAGFPAATIQLPTINASGSAMGSAAATIPGLIEAAEEVLADALGGSLDLPALLKPVPADTSATLARLLQEEGLPGWVRVDPLLMPWQTKRGLTPDGKAGPGTCTRIFEEAGMAPLVRFWPKRSTSREQALGAYASSILAASERNGATAAAALVLGREKGQAYGNPNPGAQEVITWQE